MKKLSLVSWLFIIVEFLDVLTTVIGMGMGHSELNPIANLFGMWYIYFLKFWIVYVCVIVIEQQNKSDKQYWVLYLIPIFLSSPVIWNVNKILLSM